MPQFLRYFFCSGNRSITRGGIYVSNAKKKLKLRRSVHVRARMDAARSLGSELLYRSTVEHCEVQGWLSSQSA